MTNPRMGINVFHAHDAIRVDRDEKYQALKPRRKRLINFRLVAGTVFDEFDCRITTRPICLLLQSKDDIQHNPLLCKEFGKHVFHTTKGAKITKQKANLPRTPRFFASGALG
ncbi:MAG: hypothetical protein JW719_10055, partial [Pirellulales bacterium]|nr:hypothetical protein [Pirellulales bacterium]